MEVPQSVDRNILDVYLEWQRDGPEDQGFCRNAVQRLSRLCILVVANHWLDEPVTSLGLEGDTNMLLELLASCHLPLPVLVSRLPHETYWREAYKRTYHVSLAGAQRGSALRRYLERHTAEYIEQLHPKHYDPQRISELVAMCGQVLRQLKVKQLTAGAELPSSGATSEGAHYRDMIPLGSILSGLTNLTQLSLSLGLCSRESGYSRDLRRLTPTQLRRVVQGIAQCSQLQTLSVTRSDIDCEKVHILVEGLANLENLRSLNLSHCSIGNKGALELSSFILSKPSCRELVLTNNKIGPPGAEGLAFALCQPSCKILSLDVSCNTSLGAKGVKLLLTALLRGTPLNKLKVSACGVYRDSEGGEVGGVLAAALAAGRTPLRELDVSNNRLGQDSGGTLLAALEARGSSGPTVLRVRSCFLGRWEAAIQRATLRTAARRRAAQLRFKGGARRLLQAKRIARAIGIDDEVDPLQLARQLTARPSAASLPFSLTLSLSLSQDLLLQDLPNSAREVVHIQIPPLKNPFCPTPPVEATRRRFSYPDACQLAQSKERAQWRRGSEAIAFGREAEGAPSSATNISIHLTTSRHLTQGNPEERKLSRLSS